MDDIFVAFLAGLFGDTFARWLSKYRYRVIFLATISIVYLIAFSALVYDGGLHYAVSVFVSKTLTVIGILVPVGIALIVALCVFIASLGRYNK